MKGFLLLFLLAGGLTGVLVDAAGGLGAGPLTEVRAGIAAPTPPRSRPPSPPLPDGGSRSSRDDEDFVGSEGRRNLNQVRALSVDRMAVLRRH